MTSYSDCLSHKSLYHRHKSDFTDEIIIATAVDKEGRIFTRVAKIASTYLSTEECVKII